MENKKYNSIEKAIQILLKFKEGREDLGVRELSQDLNFSPATVQRILQTLKKYNFVNQDAKTRQYFLGNVFYGFLQTLHNSDRVTRTAKRFMEEVALKTQETVHLNIIEANHRVCIYTIESTRLLRAGMPLGHRSPLYAGASAKCLLAFSSEKFIDNYLNEVDFKPFSPVTIVDKDELKKELETIREQKYAASKGERTPGLASLSVPVFNHNGDILAGISLALPEIRFLEKEYMNQCIDALKSAAESFSEVMGYKP